MSKLIFTYSGDGSERTFDTLHEALESVECDMSEIEQTYIPVVGGGTLKPKDQHTTVILNEQWLKLLYTGGLASDDDDDSDDIERT